MEEFFIGLLVFISLGILTLVIISFVTHSQQMKTIQKNIHELKNEILKNKPITYVAKEVQKEAIYDEVKVQPEMDLKPPVIEVPIVKVEETIKPLLPEIHPPVAKSAEKVEASSDLSSTPTIKPIPQPVIKKVKPVKPKTDLEKWIGEHLLSVIGIGVLVLGLVFFVKFAIDKNWINEVGRVAIGILSGGALIALAHRLRKSYNVFSSILVGGGIAVLYFTITIAFQNYHLFSQTAAFVIMVIITAFTVLLSHAYNRQIIAILAIVGGFGTPFFVSTGEGNYIVLFSYILILNLGMLVLSYLKNWYLLNVICFGFTALIYGGWLTYQITEKEFPPYSGALIFGSIFYIVFFLMNIINNVREKRKFNWSEITILLINTFLFFAAGMAILTHVHSIKLQGIFTISLALFNFFFALLLYKRDQVDRNLIYLLIGFVLTFLSLTAPIQLDGNYITLFWAAESALLLWFSQKSGLAIVKLASVILVPLMLISLVIDWVHLYNYWDMRLSKEDAEYLGLQMPVPLAVVFNKAFITSLAVSISLFINLYILKFENNLKKYLQTGVQVYRWILIPLFVVFLYLGIFLELQYQLWRHIEFNSVRQMYLGFFHFIYVFGFMLWAQWKNIHVIKEISMGIASFMLILYMVYFNREVSWVRDLYISAENVTISPFIFHYLSTIVILTMAFWLYKSNTKIYGDKSFFSAAYLWFGMLVFIFVGSTELDHLAVLTQVDQEHSISAMLLQSRKISYPIFWGLTSFALMFFGMRNKIQMLRIISLSLFAITLIKLFTWDIRGINEAGKIVAFSSLGILLLIVSFMYQKLKKLILDDEKSSKNNIVE